ncbi:hypothetical protein AWB67_04548 [Caballeronia terrestris]|jgi:hypothetical protein|uniref:Uncharacterized protein n=2 Tax=Caballeronia terrestris TaxID=1226301 RepID=A0A158K0U2_9BURK|nr:hypothetical protein AWB67_04548 [Caballeronia terrestris]
MHAHLLSTGESLMNTPLMFALVMLLVLISIPATRELFRAFRDNSAKKRLIPIRIDDRQHYRRDR